jgi:hypothetical protein
MNAILTVLDSAVTRYGRDAVADPVALAGALRAATNPLAEDDIDALARVAAGDALDRMRAAVAEGAPADQALAAAVSATDPDDSSARWACTVLGRALGYLPREPAGDTSGAGSGSDGARVAAPASPQPGRGRSRRGPLVAAVAVVALVAAAVAYLLVAPGDAAPRAAGGTAGPDPTGSATTAPAADPAQPAAAAPADPLAAFTDPGMRALAEPFLRTPGVVCRSDVAGVNVQESVGCTNLNHGHAALFTKFLNADLMRDIRRGNLEGLLHQPSTTRSLRWRFVDPVAGTRTGIPAGSSEAGEGTRIRFVQETGDPYLYFDQDSTAVAVLMTSADRTGDTTADLDELRSYWADPNR